MGSDVKKAYGASGRDEMLWFAPEALVDITDKSHPLYDERIKLPLDEGMVRNIMVHGIKVPIIVRKNGENKDGTPIVEVVDGKQRKAHVIEANKRLAKEGKELLRIPAVRARGDVGDLFGVMIFTNEVRRGDSSIIRAKKLQRYLAMGRTEEEAAITFGVTGQTIKNMLVVLELDPYVQKKIETGEISANVAMPLAKLPQEEQPAALDKMIEAGATKGHRGMEAAKQVRKSKDATVEASDKMKMRSRGLLERFRDELHESKDNGDAVALLDFVLGKPPRGLDDGVKTALVAAGYKTPGEKAAKKEKAEKSKKAA